MPGARASRGFSRGSVRRSTTWGTGVGGGTPANLSGNQTAIIGQGIVPNVEGLTIVRIRGELILQAQAIDAATSSTRITCGICKVTSDAFTAGAGSMPEPEGDVFWDGWMWWSTFGFDFNITTLGLDGVNCIRVAIDTKAMWKFEVGYTLALIAQVSDSVGATTMGIAAETRTLLKLP